MIMELVCDATKCRCNVTAEEYVIWLEILVKIGSLAYMYLQKYMDSAIIPVSHSTKTNITKNFKELIKIIIFVWISSDNIQCNCID
jgi:hypothetical protein